MDYGTLTPEQLERAKNCESIDELMQLAEEVGVELTDDQLDSLSGGQDWECPGKCYDHQCETHCRKQYTPGPNGW